MSTLTKDPKKVAAGKARAAQFTRESQQAARACVRRESLVAAGKKGFRVTGEKHGFAKAWQKAREYRLAHPSGLEREMERLLAEWDLSVGCEREYEAGERIWLDFAWPAAKVAVEVNGRIHRIPALDPDGRMERYQREKVQRLGVDGWVVIVVDDTRLGEIEDALRSLLSRQVSNACETFCDTC